MKNTLLLLLILIASHISLAKITIYSTQERKIVTIKELAQKSSIDSHFVLGEFHYDQTIHNAQAQVIKEITQYHKMEGDLTIGWEFLLGKDQKMIDIFSLLFKQEKITEKQFLHKLFYKSSDFTVNSPYLPVLKLTKTLDAQLIGLNASREVKRIITKGGGLESMNSQDLPDDFEIGSDFYLERFKQAMGIGPHQKTSEGLRKYFVAQSYTDAVMASNFYKYAQNKLHFTVVGSFHSDYFDGYVSQLEKYGANHVTTFKFVNTKGLTKEKLKILVSKHISYGYIADYIIITSL